MSHDDKRPVQINNDLVAAVGASVMGTFLAASRDLSAIDDAHLDLMADASVRAAMALSAAVPRAEDRLKAEAEAAAKAAADEKAAEDKAKADAAAAAKAAAATPVAKPAP